MLRPHHDGLRWPILAIAGILALVGALMLMATCGGTRGVEAESVTQTQRSGPVPSELTSFLGDVDPAVTGQSVFLNNVKLLPGAKPNQYFARGAKGNLIVVVAMTKPVRFKANAVADVKGTVRRLPSARVLQRQWDFDKTQLALVESQQVYVAANEILVAAVD